MTDPEKGYIRRTWEILCGICGAWDVYPCKAPAKFFPANGGWVKTKDRGWLCAKCAAQHAAEVGKAGSK